MALGSRVAFQNRAKELGVDQGAIDLLELKGTNSFGAYAYCCTFQPGQSDDTALKAFLSDAPGAAPEAALRPNLGGCSSRPMFCF